MRDVTTAVSAFIVIAVLLTGIYLGVQLVQEQRATADLVTLFGVESVYRVMDTLLQAGEASYPPPPPVTPRQARSTPTPTSAPDIAPTITATPTDTPLPPPPTPAPVPTPTPIPTPTRARPSPFPFVLAGPIRHDNACPGEYVMGTVRDAQGRPLVGATLRMEDEFGNGDTRVTKGNPGEEGRYDFVLTGPPRRVYIWVIDEGGNPLSPRVEILHRLPNSGYEAFGCHYVDWRKTP